LIAWFWRVLVGRWLGHSVGSHIQYRRPRARMRHSADFREVAPWIWRCWWGNFCLSEWSGSLNVMNNSEPGHGQAEAVTA
jgi:hypothetical protein